MKPLPNSNKYQINQTPKKPRIRKIKTVKLDQAKPCSIGFIQLRWKHSMEFRVLGFGLEILFSGIWVLLEDARFSMRN
ncbi:hypothetical protein ACLB2K_012703 [Fragaria x ananassa]